MPRRSSCIGSSPPLLLEDYILLVCGGGGGHVADFILVCAGLGRRMLTCQLGRNSVIRVSGFTRARVNILTHFENIIIEDQCKEGSQHGILEEKRVAN